MKERWPYLNLVLIGFMGVGKTVVGRELARRLKRRFLDTDAMVEEAAGMNIPQIFAEYGEDYFREREREAVESLKRFPPGSLVVATGGGVMLREENREALRQGGIIVLLKASPETVLLRLRAEGGRPLLQGDCSEAKIRALWGEREQYYRLNDLEVDTTGKSPAEVAREIMERIEKIG
ncbi:MAG: shikimate kinase [Dethiobacteria bacterium]|nr:shikimate kinase [Bacillota bacterium]HPT33924.1 shikimate kinase [Bacillota bacterium]HQD06129.1 shikimate kinase [Bacillota bacterium]